MSPEKQRIAIAEACGWKMHESYSDSWHKNSGHRYSAPAGMSDFLGRHALPDYLTDLNAMHEAEKTLDDDQWVTYGRELSRLNVFPMVHATAAQRSEAFLRTKGKFLRTIGKWEDAP